MIAKSRGAPVARITGADVRRDFDDSNVVLHYARAADRLGLWTSERLLIEHWLPDRSAPLLDAGCGAGRVALGLWELGYRRITGVDFSRGLLRMARSLAAARGAAIRFVRADLTLRLPVIRPRELPMRPAVGPQPAPCHRTNDPSTQTPDGRVRPDGACNVIRDKPPRTHRGKSEAEGHEDDPCSVGPGRSNVSRANHRFAGALLLFNGLMQIPGRARRRGALRRLRSACRPGAILLLTTHDRDDGARERRHWAAEARRWARGEQDPRLAEFGDRYFRDDHGGRTFMHLPTRAEVLEDLAATGWRPQFDALRRQIAAESAAVRAFSDECRFWVARRPA